MKLLFALLVTTACSSNPLDPGAGSQPGTGTGTLQIQGAATAEPTVPNTSDDTKFTTHLELEISLANQPVTTGQVTVKSRTGTATLTYDANGGPFGRWTGDLANYDEVYEFDVVSGADKVQAVYVDGPDIQVFTSPAAGASLDATMPNPVAWRRASRAAEARFSVGDQDGVTIDDTGSWSIPPLMLHTDSSASRPNTLRLTRTSSVTPKGAVAGSQLSVSVSQELDVIALPCTTGC